MAKKKEGTSTLILSFLVDSVKNRLESATGGQYRQGEGGRIAAGWLAERRAGQRLAVSDGLAVCSETAPRRTDGRQATRRQCAKLAALIEQDTEVRGANRHHAQTARIVVARCESKPACRSPGVESTPGFRTKIVVDIFVVEARKCNVKHASRRAKS